MTRKNKLASAIKSILLCSTATATAFSAPLFAQESQEVERIEVTGSAIKRTDIEGSLPVQVISKEQIDRSGVTTVAELIEKLPSMQGFTTAADSVGGGGGGIATASIHAIGSEYTLVLLNGRRLAPADSGSQVDLNGIPVAAIERVEVLTDGASALYGSDAIAGVVNFILKKDVQKTTVAGRIDRPQEDGGGSWNVSVTSGYGDLDSDGFNITASLVHERQDQLASRERDFAKTGIINFTHNGQDLYFFNGSGNAIPGNARVRYLDADGVEQTTTFNPYAKETGACAEQNSAIGANCFFDYTSTLEIFPEFDRTSLFLQGDLEINDNLRAFSTVVYSNFDQTTRIAPYPTGYVPVPTDSALVANEIHPHLTQDQIDNITSVAGRWRALPAGNRTTEWFSDTIHFVGGLQGNMDDIDYSTGFTFSRHNMEQNYPTGWLLLDPFVDAVSSGAINIFAHPSELTDADKAALAPTVYSGPWDDTTITLLAFDAKASKPIFDLDGGSAYLAAGFDVRQYRYEREIASANENEELLFLSKDTPYDLQRRAYGLFTELSMPVLEQLDINASLRYDSIGAVEDKLNGGDVNDDEGEVTYKISAAFEATDDLKLRAAYGTGFKAATMRQIGEPRSDFGVTSDTYECPFDPTDELAQYCLTGANQYNVFRQGYDGLEPETSTQYTFGFVYAPTQELSFGADYWSIELEDAVTRLEEGAIFANPEQYRDLFTTKTNLATGEEELAIIQAAVNIGKAEYTGIDWHADITNKFAFGELKTSLNGTLMLKARETRPGTDDDWLSDLGSFNDEMSNQGVTFRHVIKLETTLSHDDFAHTLAANFRSGYKDQFKSAEECYVTEVDAFGDCVDVQLDVSSYYTFDWQTQYKHKDTMVLTAGINNLLDEEPPLSLRTAGAGHQLGYDPRYVDVLGRTFYASASYTF